MLLATLLLPPSSRAGEPVPAPAQAREQAQQRSWLRLEQREYLDRQGTLPLGELRALDGRLQRQQRALEALQQRQAQQARQLRLRQDVGLPAPEAAGLRQRQAVETRGEWLRLRQERAGWPDPVQVSPPRARIPALER